MSVGSYWPLLHQVERRHDDEREAACAGLIPASDIVAEIDANISLSDFAFGFDILVNMSETDLQLLTRYTSQRAEDAFAEIVRRHLDLVHSAAMRQVRSPELAEEVAQAVFIELARQARHLPPRTVLAAWLYHVTRRRAIDVVRREAGRRLREQTAQELQAMNATAEDWTHIEPLLDDAMDALGETDRLAVLLRYFQNKPLHEVGRAIGVTDDAAQKRVSRAVERLRKIFSKRGITVGASGLAVAISANSIQAAPAVLAKTATAVAIANGATASTSTLTLKGALKVMAWSKAKTAAIATLAIILTAGTTTLVIKTIHVSRAAANQSTPDNEAEITARVRGLKLEELRAEDCTPEFWQQLQQSRQSVNPDLAKVAAAVGPLLDVTLMERTEDHGRPSYLYRMKYQNLNVNVLFRIIFDGKKIAYAEGYPEPK